MNLFRCVDDGFCSEEQADLIQLHVEKKLRSIYKIDEVLGKSSSNSLPNEDVNEGEDNSGQKHSAVHQDSPTNNDTSETQAVSMDLSMTNKTAGSKSETNADTSSALNLSNQISSASPRSNLSPGEIKPVSPSSLSEESPISN